MTSPWAAGPIHQLTVIEKAGEVHDQIHELLASLSPVLAVAIVFELFRETVCGICPDEEAIRRLLDEVNKSILE